MRGLTRASLDNLSLSPTLGVALALGVAFVATGCGAGDAPTSPIHASKPTSASAKRGATKASAADLASARRLGRQACAGMTPLEAARHFQRPARRAGVKASFARFVAEPTPSTFNSPGYARLVGALYASTVPAEQRGAAAAGCAEELAADGEGGEATSGRTGQTAPPSQGGAHQKGSN